VADHELGIFFNLEESSGRKYEAEAWEVFMRHTDPELLKDTQLFQGEVSGLLLGTGRMYCIGVRTKDLIVVQYLKEIFASSDDSHLAPAHDRIRESDVIQKYELKRRGQIDSQGRLETDTWRRVDHHLCKVTGWPYVPHTYPKHLSPEKLDELEKMEEPGVRTPVSSDSLPPLARAPRSKASSSPVGGRRRIAVYVAIAVVLVGLLVFGWLARGRIFAYLGERKDNLSLRMELGSEAYGKVQDGFALAGIKKIPHDLDLDALNAKLSDRAYYFLQHKDESVYDVTADCMVWFAPSEKRGSAPETTMQAFIKIGMHSRRDNPLWACQSKAERSAPGTEQENPNLRHEALKAAIQNIDLTCLADGRSVKSFQANNDFPGLNKHVQYLLDNCKGGAAKVESTTKRSIFAFEGTQLERAELETRLRDFLADKWIPTTFIYLKNGKKLSALILEQRSLALNLRLTGGKTSITRNQIEKIKPFGKEQFAEEIETILEPMRKGLENEWEYEIYDDIVAELTEKCVTYGPPFPGAYVLNVDDSTGTGKMKALIMVGRSRKTLRDGDKIKGFKVIGIDPETSTVLVRMGQNGEILRIWPKPQA
jgi:hypothetical protein